MTTDMTAKDFAEAVQGMRFGDVMTVVSAINQANTGTRNRIDGKSLIKAAQLIIDGNGGLAGASAKPPAPIAGASGPKLAGKTPGAVSKGGGK